MPAQAAIHFRARCKANETWSPAYAGMTSPKNRLPVDKFRTPRVKAEGVFS